MLSDVLRKEKAKDARVTKRPIVGSKTRLGAAPCMIGGIQTFFTVSLIVSLPIGKHRALPGTGYDVSQVEEARQYANMSERSEIL